MMELHTLCSFLTVLLFLISPAAVAGDQERDMIRALPGQPPDVHFSQYSGFITVDEQAEHSLFYWLVQSPVTPTSKPLILWLNGGPGCSSVGTGAFEEVGPFRVHPDGTLTLAPHAWDREANMLFLDSPVGVGFSKSRHSPEMEKIGDKRTAEEAYTFLVKWLERFPQYKHRPFYIAGESYAGHYIPELSQLIVRRNKGKRNPVINFKGFLLGNPAIDDYYDSMGRFEYWWSHGLISDSTYEELNKFCLNDPFLFPHEKCSTARDRASDESGNIDEFDTRNTPCPKDVDDDAFEHKMPTFRGKEECIMRHSTAMYMNSLVVQRVFKVITNNTPRPWQHCSGPLRTNWTDSPRSMLPILKELIAARIQIWIFSGDMDAMVPLTSTRYSVRALKLKIKAKWHAWYDHDLEVGGWTETYQGLTLVIVKGAGHKVPLAQPRLALQLLTQFLKNQPMPSDK